MMIKKLSKFLKYILVAVVMVSVCPDASAFHHFHRTVVHHRSNSSRQISKVRNQNHTTVKHLNRNNPHYVEHHYNNTTIRPFDRFRVTRMIIWLNIIKPKHHSQPLMEEELRYRVFFKDGDVIDYNIKVDKETYEEYFASGKLNQTFRGINYALREGNCRQIIGDDVWTIVRLKKQ